MFLHLDTLAAIRARVEAGDEPWTTAYEWFMSDTYNALQSEPEGVTTGDRNHEFTTAGPDDPDNRGDYKTAIRVGDQARDLGLAYQLTGEDEYARGAVDVLDCWFLAHETYMKPEPTASIELFITLPKMWWGAELVRGHDAWERAGVGDESTLREWVATFLDQLSHEVPTTFGQQNIFNWLELTHAAGGVYLRDWDRFRTAMSRNRETGFDQLREDGLLENELPRHKSLTYSIFAMKALTTAAEISRLYADRLDGPTIYEYAKFDGSRTALERMYDTHAPYILDPQAWRAQSSGPDDERFRTGEGFPARSMEKAGALYEVAYSRFRKDAYVEVVTAGGRPVKNQPTYVEAQQEPIEHEGRPRRDERVLGWTTLTHGEQFRLDGIPDPRVG